MEQGRKKLEGVLSAVTYQSILGELNKDCYSHSDFLDLSQQLGLTEFYQELTGRDVGFINCSELLLQRWATVYPEDVSKENLSRIFKETLSLKNIALLLDYEGSELIANSWIKIHTSKLNLESGGRKNPIQKSRLSDCLDHEEVVRDVLGPPQYQQIMVASDKDILDHLAILEIVSLVTVGITSLNVKQQIPRMKESCSFVLQYNTEALVLVLQHYSGK